MFTGPLQVNAMGSSVGHLVALVPHKNSIILGVLNSETQIYDIMQVASIPDPLATAIKTHLAGGNHLALVCISSTQLSWLARKTASKGCSATPASKLMLNLTAPLFAPISCVTDEAVFFHYLLIQLPAHIYFKEAPTGKYTTLHGNGFNVLNVWVSDMITGEMLVAAAGKSCVVTCIACQKSGSRLLRSTSGTTLVCDMALVPHGLVFSSLTDVVPKPMVGVSPDGFEDCYVPAVITEQSVTFTPPRTGVSWSAPPTPLSANATPVKGPPPVDNVAPSLSRHLVMHTLTEVKKEPHVCGLANEGNTCFINVTLQGLYACNDFRNMALSAAVQMVRHGKAPSSLTELVNALFLHMYLSPKTDISASAVVVKANLVGQHDAQEFMLIVINSMKAEVPQISKLLELSMRSCTRCFECDQETSCVEPFMILDVPLREGTTNLQDLLQVCLQPERMQGNNKFKCEACGHHTEARRQLSVQRAPETLLLCLKLFSFDEVLKRRTKLMTHVTAPHLLALPTTQCTYHLRAVIAHCGASSEAGHYVCAHDVSGTWMVYDDKKYYKGDIVSVSKGPTPYLFIYSRLDATDDFEVPYIPDLVQWVSAMDNGGNAPRAVVMGPCATTISCAVDVKPAPTAAMMADVDLPMMSAWSNTDDHNMADPPSLVPKGKRQKKEALPTTTLAVPVTKSFADIVKDHDVDLLEGKQVMVEVKEGPIRGTVLGGGLSQLRVQQLGSGIRRVPWSALLGFAE